MVTGGPYANEDINKNLILDPGEDVGLDPGHGDGSLTPPNAAAGALPATVETDENGVGNFNLVYLKSSAVWIDDAITASTLVLGTETTSTLRFRLPYLVGDKIYLPDSPYGVGSLLFTIMASAGTNGTISPSGGVDVEYGDDQTFMITPYTGYDVALVMVDSLPVTSLPQAGGSYFYTFENVSEDHTIQVTFEDSS